jgi:Tol biopolymer transport system component
VSLRNGSNELWEVPVDGGEAMPLTTSSGRLPVNAANRLIAEDISPDGKLLLYNEELTAFSLFSYRLDTRERGRISHTLDIATQPHPMPNGKDILIRSIKPDRSYAVVLSLKGGEERILTPADSLTVTPDGRELVYAINDAQGGVQLWVLALAGGTARQIAKFPCQIAHLSADPKGWVHVLLREGSTGMILFKVPLAGGAPVAEEAPDGAVVSSAPTGGWFLVGMPLGSDRYRWQIIEPDRPLTSPPLRAFEARSPIAWASDGQSLLYWTGSEIRRHVLATGEEEMLLRSELLEGGMALSPDGKTLYMSEWVGRSTRHMIVNFDQRPRPVH